MTGETPSALSAAYIAAFLLSFLVSAFFASRRTRRRWLPTLDALLPATSFPVALAVSVIGLLFGAERVLGIDALPVPPRVGMQMSVVAATVLICYVAASIASLRIIPLIPRRRTDAVASLLIFIAILSACFLTASGSMNTIDFEFNYRLTQALVDTQTVYLAPHSDGLYQGRWVSPYGIGLSILSTPLYAAAGVLGLAVDPTGDPGRFARFFVMLTNNFVTAGTGVVIYLVCRRLGFRRSISSAVVLAWALTTPAWVYADTLFGEPVIGLCLVTGTLMLLEYEARQGRDRFLALALASFSLGYALVTRVSSAVLVPLFLAYSAYAALRHPEGSALRLLSGLFTTQGRHRRTDGSDIDSRSLVQAVAALAMPLAVLAASVLWYNFARFGRPLDFGYAGYFFSSPLAEGVYGLLASPGKGVLEYAPLVALGLASWPAFMRARPSVAILFAGVIGATLLQAALWQFWWGGRCWGPRFLVPVLPLALVPLGYVLSTSPVARRAAWFLSAVGFIVTAAGSLTDINAYYGAALAAGYDEPTVSLRPDLSPILGYIRYVLEGQGVDSQSVRVFLSDRVLYRLVPLALLTSLTVSLTLLLGCAGVARENTGQSPGIGQTGRGPGPE